MTFSQTTAIPFECPYPSQQISVLDSTIHYLEVGEGDPILFLHEIPASSYSWRNIIGSLSHLGRCIAPDLIGMGKSGKPEIAYTIGDHIRYIEAFIQHLNLKKINFVLHGWGSIIGFYLAMKYPDLCRSLVFYEAYLHPFTAEEFALPYEEQLFLLESEESKHNIVSEAPYFVEKMLRQSIVRPLTQIETKHYLEPFLEKNAGKALMQYMHALNNPNDEVNQMISDYSKKLIQSTHPKLMLYGVPGFITSMSTVIWAKKNLTQLEVSEVGEALHYAQEDNPFLMAETMSVWLQGIEQYG